MPKLYLKSAPYVHSRSSASRMMLSVILALLPAAAAGCLNYGKQACLVLAVSVVSAVIFEAVSSLIIRRKLTIMDMSAAVTGLILGMLLPPDLTLWKAAVGSFIAIVIVKQLFGGIGKNFANPAGTAWIAMLLLFTKEMTTWRIPDTGAVTRVTPIISSGTSYWDLLLGNYASYIGTGCAAALLLGAVFLCFTGIISPAAPLSFMGSFALLSFVCRLDTLSELLSGSVVLAACFMAADYTTTPFSTSGKLLFGLGCGILAFLIRQIGGFADSAVFAVVIMNLFTPILNRLTRQKPFGAAIVQKQKKQKKQADLSSSSEKVTV